MQAEIISIGDELTSGQRLDTNSQWLSTRLGELGVQTVYHTTVADDLAANIEVFRHAAERVDLVVATGGLGPTADDLTRDAIAAAANVDLVLDPAALAHIENLFARRKRPMPPQNRLQAMFPRGSRVIPNPAGTAPGIDLDFPRSGRQPSRIFALPGVPAEMREMWEQTVAPGNRGDDRLAAGDPPSANQMLRRRRKRFGADAPRSDPPRPRSASRHHRARGDHHAADYGARQLGRGVFPRDGADCRDDSRMPRQSGFRRRGRRIGACRRPIVDGTEKNTGHGRMGKRRDDRRLALGHVAGEGLFFRGHRRSQRRGVAKDFSERMTATSIVRDKSQATARMAQECRAKFAADFGLAVGELPPVDPQATEPPLLHFAVADENSVTVKSAPYAGHPDILKARGAKQALNLLRLTLLHAHAIRVSKLRHGCRSITANQANGPPGLNFMFGGNSFVISKCVSLIDSIFQPLENALRNSACETRRGPISPGSLSLKHIRKSLPPGLSTCASPATYFGRCSSENVWNNPESMALSNCWRKSAKASAS